MTIKKISIDRLEPGMFVHDLNWSANSGHLIVGHFRVQDEQQVASLRKLGARELYIDTLQGNDVHDAPTLQEVRRQLESQLLEIGQSAGQRHAKNLQEEIETARAVHEDVATHIGNLMRQVRSGKLEEVGHELADLTQNLSCSLAHNPHALISLARVRDKDNYTFLHSVGTAILMGAFGNTLQLSNEPKNLSYPRAICLKLRQAVG